jgi:predicted PurR-regulated permease PerM
MAGTTFDVRPPRRSPLLDHPLWVAFGIIVLFGLVHVLWTAAPILLLSFLSILIATLLSYPLGFFARFMPRVLALILTILIVVGIFCGVVLIAVPIVSGQAQAFVSALPVALERLQDWWSAVQRSGPIPAMPPGSPGIAERVVREVEALLTHAIPVAIGAGSVLVTAFALFVLALFFAYSPESYRAGVRALVPREHEPLLDELWTRLGVTLRGWTAGILGSMLTMGVLAAIGLYVAGIDGWFLLGIVTFFGTFVPYVGAIASAVPGLLIGLAQSPKHFLYAAIVYALVHLVEGYLVSPLIMRSTVRLRPGTLLFWQLFMAAVFGIPGIIVATPLLACLEIAVGYLYVERRLGKPAAMP